MSTLQRVAGKTCSWDGDVDLVHFRVRHAAPRIFCRIVANFLQWPAFMGRVSSRTGLRTVLLHYSPSSSMDLPTKRCWHPYRRWQMVLKYFCLAIIFIINDWTRGKKIVVSRERRLAGRHLAGTTFSGTTLGGIIYHIAEMHLRGQLLQYLSTAKWYSNTLQYISVAMPMIHVFKL